MGLLHFVAEVQRAKRASALGKRLRANVRPSVQILGEGEGRLEIFLTVTHMGN